MTLIACTADYAAMLGKLVSAEKGLGGSADWACHVVRDTATALGLPENSIQSWLNRELSAELAYACGINRSIQSHIRQAVYCYDWSDEAHHLPHSIPAWQSLSFIHLQETPRTQLVGGRRQYVYPLDAFRDEVMKFSD